LRVDAPPLTPNKSDCVACSGNVNRNPETLFVLKFFKCLKRFHHFVDTLMTFMCKRTPFGGVKEDSGVRSQRRSAPCDGRHAPLKRRSAKVSSFGSAIGSTARELKSKKVMLSSQIKKKWRISEERNPHPNASVLLLLKPPWLDVALLQLQTWLKPRGWQCARPTSG